MFFLSVRLSCFPAWAQVWVCVLSVRKCALSSPSTFQLVSSKAKKNKNLLKALPPPPLSYFLSSDQSVFVFGKLDIHPLHFFFFFGKRAFARACNDSSWTVAFKAWMHIPKRVRPGCQDHTAVLQQSAGCRQSLLSSARTGAQSDSIASHPSQNTHTACTNSLCHKDTLTSWETKAYFAITCCMFGKYCA